MVIVLLNHSFRITWNKYLLPMSNPVVTAGLTERIIGAFDPRKPLGRRRFLIYTILFYLVVFSLYMLFIIMLDPGNTSSLRENLWLGSVLPSLLMAPAWLFIIRRAVAAKIPLPVVYAWISWELVFDPICKATIGDTLERFLTVPLVVLVIGLLFKRNRMELPYPVN